jgi:nitroreductase
MGADSTPGYELLYDIIRRRASVRKLKPDPIPDEYVQKILEAGRWAMSGANSQPWEYIVVKDPKVKKDLFRCYSEDNTDFIYWMEQQRVFELRHPAYQMTADAAVERQRRGAGWSEAPALIVVVGDGRRQWGTVQGAHTFGRDQSHLTDGLANTCTFMHLAAVSLGLATQWRFTFRSSSKKFSACPT